MNDDELGRSITQAVRFLREVYQDVAHLLTALDGLMAERQWQPMDKNEAFDWLSTGMAPTKWVLKHQCRWYIPAGNLANFQDVIAFAILYDPPSIFDSPVVLVAAAHFCVSTNEAVLEKRTSFDAVVKSLGAKPEPGSLTAQEVHSFLPGANRGAAFVMPLCRLTGTDTLLSLCVAPVLALEKEQRRQEGEMDLAQVHQQVRSHGPFPPVKASGEVKLAQAHWQEFNRSKGTQSAPVAIVGELCGQYGISQERADAIRKDVVEKWQQDHRR